MGTTASTLTLGLLLGLAIGLGIGVTLGWFWRASRRHQPFEQPSLGLAPADLSNSLLPLREAVAQLDGRVHSLQLERASEHSSLAAQVQAINRTSARLSDRTDQLINALRAPQIRGRWGEMQLERVVELGGMVKHCDFDVQVTTRLGEQWVRPDMIIRLSGGRQIIVDSKVPLSAYLDSLDEKDPEVQAGYRRRHAYNLRTHVNQLADKRYTEAFSPTPEFVICFVPADPFLDSALAEDPEILEHAFERSVVIATPTTLFALLRTVALGWRSDDISHKAEEVLRLGRQLYRRLGTFADHYNKIGSHLDKAVDAYNATLASVDSRVMVTARRLEDMDIPARVDRQSADIRPASSRPRRATWDESGDITLA